MKKIFLMLVVAVVLSCSDNYEESDSDHISFEGNIVSRDELNQKILSEFNKKGDFSWRSLSEGEIASAFVNSDSLVLLAWNENSMDNHEKKNILSFISEHEAIDLENGDIVIENDDLKYIVVKLKKLDTFLKLRTLPDVQVFEPEYEMFDMEKEIGSTQVPQKSLDFLTGDYTSQYKNHFIKSAWDAGINGDNIKVAIIDGGLFQWDSIYGTDNGFNVDQTRTLAKTGFYKPFLAYFYPFSLWSTFDGSYERSGQYPSGHGTKMVNIIGGPDFTDFKGIAYKSDMSSVRSSWTVWLDPYENHTAVANAYNNLSTQNDVRIISMSMGGLFSHEDVSRAIKKCTSKGKLVFNAAGTFVFPGLQQALTVCTGLTLFPARMEETVACTAVNEVLGSLIWCPAAFGLADFVCEFDGNGASSQATASTAAMAALIWSTNPQLTSSQVLGKMIEASDYVSPNYYFGHGRVNMQTFVNNM